MDWTNRTKIAPVNPHELRRAYLKCRSILEHLEDRRAIPVGKTLKQIHVAVPRLSRDEVVQVFRRLCLTLDLTAYVDANWKDAGFTAKREYELPFALFELASVEPAYEAIFEGYASVHFEHDLLDEAFATFQLN